MGSVGRVFYRCGGELLEALLQNVDIRMVFTAHPTESVRHTVRHKQRRVASLLQRWLHLESKHE